MTKLWLAATLAVLAFAGAAASAAQGAEVSVRVEGASSTLLETVVETTVHAVDGGDGSGQHLCRGPIGEQPGPTVTGALDDATRVSGLGWKGQWSSSSGDFLVTEVAGEAATSSGSWTILLNGMPTPVGGCSMKVREGDQVLFARDVVFQTMTLGLSGPSTVEPGRQFSLSVDDERDGGVPVSGAEVRSGGIASTTGADGRAVFTIDAPGTYDFKASHPDGIRSNSIELCVGVDGCVDTPNPTVRILDVEDGARFMRGATIRTVRGTMRSESGRDETLRLAIAFRGYRGRCKAWNGIRERLVRRRCGAKLNWLTVPSSDSRWSLPTGNLPPGGYRVFARLQGVAPVWRSGLNRISFTVRPRKLRARLLLRQARRYLSRQVRRPTVRRSALLAGWVGLALGKRGTHLLPALKIKRPGSATTGELARMLAAIVRVRAARSNPAMRRELLSRQSDDGSFGEDVNLTAMAVLALPGSRAAARAATWLVGVQQDNGGFSAGGAGNPDVDTTGLVAWAMEAEGHDEEVIEAASFVRSTQNPDGGFPAAAGGSSNAQSTGLGLLAVHLAGGGRLGPRTVDGITPTHYLATLEHRSGSINYMGSLRTMPVWVTSQAALGLASATSISARR